MDRTAKKDPVGDTTTMPFKLSTKASNNSTRKEAAWVLDECTKPLGFPKHVIVVKAVDLEDIKDREDVQLYARAEFHQINRYCWDPAKKWSWEEREGWGPLNTSKPHRCIGSHKHFGNRTLRPLPQRPVLELPEELQADETDCEEDDGDAHGVGAGLPPAERGVVRFIPERLGTQQKNGAGTSGRVGARSTLQNHCRAGFARRRLGFRKNDFGPSKRMELVPDAISERLGTQQKNGAGRNGRVGARSTLRSPEVDARGVGAGFDLARTTWDPAKEWSWEEREGWGPLHTCRFATSSRSSEPYFLDLMLETECVVWILKPVGLVPIAEPDSLDLIVRLDSVVSEITPHLKRRLHGRRRRVLFR
ncbi:hypothetical protein FN846DRAFT_894837 [Sphaerosporella brunnea]|uniref:Uncharacterized protein n=1 Tax=Sphaerosporella brunnea TaxID=1250544 RepID=A0A5J5EI81_9PEZI|nr:hypothetical protein FN846DRAFT_894837 [Sphaerosporella brunnea]